MYFNFPGLLLVLSKVSGLTRAVLGKIWGSRISKSLAQNGFASSYTWGPFLA